MGGCQLSVEEEGELGKSGKGKVDVGLRGGLGSVVRVAWVRDPYNECIVT